MIDLAALSCRAAHWLMTLARGQLSSTADPSSPRRRPTALYRRTLGASLRLAKCSTFRCFCPSVCPSVCPQWRTQDFIFRRGKNLTQIVYLPGWKLVALAAVLSLWGTMHDNFWGEGYKPFTPLGTPVCPFHVSFTRVSSRSRLQCLSRALSRVEPCVMKTTFWLSTTRWNTSTGDFGRLRSFKRTIKLVGFSQFLKCFNHKSHLPVRVYFSYTGLCACVCVCMGSCKCWFQPCCPCLFNIVMSL